jgi:Na+-transporting NADH:ubiquinone oxidoreductase subunit NqrB
VVLVLAVASVLAVLSVTTFPCWSHSARWGYMPSVIAGTLLLCVAMVVVSSKYAPKSAEPHIAMAATTPAYGAYSAYRRTVDPVILAPDNTPP